MDDQIDVVCADGRGEAPEHHLIAKFASHIGMDLADLRTKVRERLQRPASRPQVEPRLEPEIRIIEESPAPKTAPRRESDPPRKPEIEAIEPSLEPSSRQITGKVEMPHRTRGTTNTTAPIRNRSRKTAPIQRSTPSLRATGFFAASRIRMMVMDSRRSISGFPAS